ncbi:hypothetical protein IKE97_01780 [Candidatus Saccharibacteria bacterium]|nr:hypothetical protein [Candidatus Saccharibacteria bacterium]
MIQFINSILIALVVVSCVAVAECMFQEKSLLKLTFDEWIKASTIGVVVGTADFLLTVADAFLATAALVCLVAVICYLVYWWHQEGGYLKEMVPFLVAFIPIFLVMKANAARIVEFIDQPFWGSVINALPAIIIVIALGLIVADFFHFRYTEIDGEDSDAMRLHRVGAIAALGIMAVLVAGTVCSAINWSALSPATAYGDDDGTEGDGGWAYFFNLVVRDDEDPDNDFNFGPCPEDDDAAGYDEEFRSRIVEDPALGAADMAWLDAIVGTRYLGEFYQSCRGDWAKTINRSKEEFIANPVLYSNTREAFFKFLDKATVTVETRLGLEDQMYMNGYTKDGVPDVIVLKTKNHSGKFLVYTFKIKGNTFRVGYRIECGFQPTNVEAVMGIKPQSTPKKPKKPGKPANGDNGKPKKPSKPGKGDNGKPSYDKDPKDGKYDDGESNDDKGPHEDTNNPSDPQHSTKDTPDSSSNSGGTYEDYRKDQKEKEDTNANQKEGGDSNAPSTKPSSGTKTDNNGDSGTGHGGADTSTPTSDKAKEADTGKPVKDKPGEAWEGPSD